MLVTPEQFLRVLEWIVEDARRCAGPSVVILVSPDTDAMCACRMFCALLQVHDVQYSVTPVSSYEGLQEAWGERIESNTEVPHTSPHNAFLVPSHTKTHHHTPPHTTTHGDTGNKLQHALAAC